MFGGARSHLMAESGRCVCIPDAAAGGIIWAGEYVGCKGRPVELEVRQAEPEGLGRVVGGGGGRERGHSAAVLSIRAWSELEAQGAYNP